MMPDMQFKCYNKKEKVMYPSWPWYKSNFFELHDNGTLRDYAFLMSTGVKDKEGEDIYSDYLVRYGNRKELFRIVFQNAGFHLESKSGKHIIHLSALNNIKVAGNIYENPDWWIR